MAVAGTTIAGATGTVIAGAAITVGATITVGAGLATTTGTAGVGMGCTGSGLISGTGIETVGLEGCTKDALMRASLSAFNFVSAICCLSLERNIEPHFLDSGQGFIGLTSGRAG